MEAEEPAKRNPAASLPDEILVEILRRLPVRSVCRFKCVSRSWRDLISDPAHRKKLPQTLTGFFYSSYNEERFPSSARHFTNITGKGGAPLIVPSLSFLPAATDNADDVELMDSCNGLLLCHCRCFGPCLDEDNWNPPFHYVVCNPATNKWVMLPDGSGEDRIACLAFDPAVSSHFYVVEYVLDEDSCVAGVEIYSSKTAAWSFKENEWGSDIMLHDSSVFLNGFMHMVTFADGVAVVDMEGKIWRTIPVPSNGELGRIHRSKGWIHQSQGRLCFLDGSDRSKLSVWTLEDHASNEWTLKHSVGMMFLFRQKNLLAPFEFDLGYTLVAFHPECNLIYFVYGLDKTLMAYDMDRKEVRVIRNLGYDCSKPYLPYVPWFSEALADEQ
ncbi:hypothetical protein HU200_049167 [Digitaria exilis]|uniref:F-box domain-containing protein n=1 Tax=Digitaria exilis TaxID=1010633 RepID=A0A835ECA5_9POAL|nr:hypothetical protein HU200_049167 [Digitaria exilis]